MAVPTLLAGEIPNADKWTTVLSFLGRGIVKQATENVNNTTVMQSDDELRLTYVANALYTVNASIVHSSNNTADFKFQMAETGGGGTTGRFDVVAIAAAGTALTIQSGALGVAFTGEGASADRSMILSGWLVTGSAVGDLVVQWAQNTANVSTTSVVAGSWLEIRRMS